MVWLYTKQLISYKKGINFSWVALYIMVQRLLDSAIVVNLGSLRTNKWLVNILKSMNSFASAYLPTSGQY